MSLTACILGSNEGLLHAQTDHRWCAGALPQLVRGAVWVRGAQRDAARRVGTDTERRRRGHRRLPQLPRQRCG